MKATKMSTILVLALGLMVCPAKVSEAAPMGTAFTYQGRLIDANSPADGLYDFQFKLFDDANVVFGNQIGSDVNVPDMDVIDGYLTVELDFGSSVFDGNAVWLEIGLRPGDLNDPNVYTTLSPRQELGPTPYAIYANTSGAAYSLNAPDGSPNALYVDNDGRVGIGTTSPQALLHVREESVILTDESNSNVGIGTTGPESKLDVIGSSSDPIIFGTNVGSGEGIYGESSDGTAVYGESHDGYGVHGESQDGCGVYGVGATGLGVLGTSLTSWGVQGMNLGSQGNYGVLGDASVGAAGFHANSRNFGVLGESEAGVYGEHSGTGNSGVLGHRGCGVFGEATGSDTAGVRGEHSASGNYGVLGGNDYGVKSEGDLVVTGAYRGTIGPNGGAPFPRPAYDSGWVTQDVGRLTLFHNIGGNVDNYVVDAQAKLAEVGLNDWGYWNLTTNSIELPQAYETLTVRVRIWVYN